ncbi:MAG: cytochrome c biogenesis protein [Elusimicrobiota bacterium]
MKKKLIHHWPWAVVSFFIIFILFSFKSPHHKSDFHIENFGTLPVLHGGRIKPIDTVARVSLLLIHGKQSVKFNNKKISALEWVLNLSFRPQEADRVPVFRIDDPDVLGLIHKEQRSPPNYSFSEITPAYRDIESEAGNAEPIKPEIRTAYQKSIIQLHNKLILYQKLQNTLANSDINHFVHFLTTRIKDDELHRFTHFKFLSQVAEFFPIPEMTEKTLWTSIGQSLLNQGNNNDFHPSVMAFAKMGDAYRQSNAIEFNNALLEHQKWITNKAPQEVSLAKKEIIFNRVQPFMKSLIIYLIAGLFIFVSWLKRSNNWLKTAHRLVVLAVFVHSIGLITRMILQGRPPVTNLYSSAIFVGWVAVLLGLILEKIYRNSAGLLVSTTIGFLTMIIAHHLANTGDTLEMMRAVLDTNFWLATHVVTVTIGYSSTFLSGFLAIIIILRRFFQRDWPKTEQKAIESMIFGVICFSTFFSFIGTILGGIWADQSWGRFWGWDPKENGALLIVLWNAFILHARKLGITKGMRLMNLSIVGNIITAFSWFGVNMLGIGLHSYGFMDKAFSWLVIFTISQAIVIGMGLHLEKGK